MYKLSMEAAQDLRKIGRHTQQSWGADQRRKYFDDIGRKFGFIADHPLANPERTEFDPPVRIHHRRRHLILYPVTGECILIVRVLHQSIEVGHKLAAAD